MTDTAQHAPLARSMHPIVDAIGYDLAIQLVARRGGTRVLVRASPDPRDAVSAAIGHDAAVMLAAAIGAGHLDVPRCLFWILARRNEEILARSAHGETQEELALRFNLTERRIRQIFAEADVPDVPDVPIDDLPQPDLFSAEEGASQ